MRFPLCATAYIHISSQIEQQCVAKLYLKDSTLLHLKVLKDFYAMKIYFSMDRQSFKINLLCI